MGNDYAPVSQDEDELEPRSRYLDYAAEGQYPPVAPAPASPAPAASASGYPPVESPAAPVSAIGSLGDLEARAARPKTAIQDEAPPPVTPRPQWKDYAPAQPTSRLGKFGHALEEMFTPLPRLAEQRAERNYKNALDEYGAPAAEAKTKAETEQKESEAELERGQADALTHPKPTEEQFKVVPGMVGPNGQVLQEGSKGTLRWGDGITGAAPLKPPSDTATQNKENFQHGIGVLRGEGLIGAADVTDFKKIAAAVNNSKSLSPEEKNSMVGYMGANPTPSTNLQVHITGQQEGNALAEDKMFTGKEVIVHGADGSRKQMSYGDAKKAGVPLDQMTILNAGEAQKNRDADASISATMNSLKTYRNDFKATAPKLTETDRASMKVLTSHMQAEGAGFLAGLWDEIPIGGQAVGEANRTMKKFFEGTSTQAQYAAMTPEGKKLVADYFTQVIANFANMKAILGTVGRNPAQIQAEIGRVPLPYLDWQSADALFNSTRDDIKTRASSLPQFH